MPKYQKRHNPITPGTSSMNTPPTGPIEPTTVGTASQDGNQSSPTTEEQNPNAELLNLVQSVKALQNNALDELEKEMDALSDAFTARAVEIVQRGTQQCFLQAARQISQIQIGWTSGIGGLLDGNTIDTLALPGSITAGDTE